MKRYEISEKSEPMGLAFIFRGVFFSARAIFDLMRTEYVQLALDKTIHLPFILQTAHSTLNSFFL